jgi:hypothetical protein
MTMLDPQSMPHTEIYRPLAEWMGAFRRQVRGRLLLDGLARLTAAAVAVAFLTFVVDRAFRLSPPVRFGVLAAGAAALFVLACREIIMPLWSRLDPLTLASALDRAAGADGAITARVATVMGLPALLAGPDPPSSAFVRQAVLRSQQTLAGLDYRSRLDDRRRNLSALLLTAALLLPAIVTAAAPATVRLWAARTFLGSAEPWPQKTYLQVAGVTDGTLVVPRGEPFLLRVSAKDGSVVPDSVTIRVREGHASRLDSSLTAFGHNDFRYDSPGIHDTAVIELRGGDDILGPITLRPADRPRITDLKLITQHPTEPRPQTHSFSGEDSDLSFLPRTHMQLLFTANTPIDSAHVVSSTSRPSTADLRQLDDQHFSLAWDHEADVRLQIDLVSRDAHLASTPTEVAIGLKTDHPPRVTLGFTGVRQRVTPMARIPLTVDARDDYGVASAGLSLKIETPDPANPGKFLATTRDLPLFGPAAPATDLEVQQAHTLELDPMKLPPGSLVTVNAVATDACYTGAQTSRSRLVAFRVVPPEELFREILLRQQAERAKFRKQADEARAIRGQFIALDKGGASQISEIARRHRAVQREVAAVRTVLSDTVTEMRLNALGTDQAYEMIQTKVITPLTLLGDELMNPQKDALEALSPTDAKAIADAQDRQDKIVARMDEILKQMSQWDSFVDVLNQLNEIIRLQGQAEQQTIKLEKQQKEGVFEK